jgi:MFS family permease
MVIVQGPVLNVVSRKWSDKMLLSVGSLILAISFIFFTSRVSWLIYAGAAVLALGNGIMWPTLLSLISKESTERFQGVIQGYASSLGSAASIIGLFAGGILYSMIGGAIFLLSFGVILVIFIMTVLVFGVKEILVEREIPDSHG